MYEWIEKLIDFEFFRTKKGFVFATFFILLVTNCLFPFKETPKESFLIFISLFIIYIVLWFLFSGRFFFSRKKIKIVFAIDCEGKALNYLKIIQKEAIDYFLNIPNLSIQILKAPKDLRFQNHQEVSRYIRKWMIDLFIGGHVLEGNVDKDSKTQFKLFFHYLYKNVPERQKIIFVKNITKALQGKYWHILKNNSFHDLQIVTDNLKEAALFIVGVCLYVRGRLGESVKIFENLHANIVQGKFSFPETKTLEQIIFYLHESYHFLFLLEKEQNKLFEAREYLFKMLKLKQDDSRTYIALAYISYVLDNDLNQAKAYTEKIGDDYKSYRYYNKAFFAILDEFSKEVLENYHKIRYDDSINSVNPIDIRIFLQNEHEKYKNNILFHFALGYVNRYHGDVSFARKELAKFAEKAKNIKGYSELVEVSNKLLNKIK